MLYLCINYYIQCDTDYELWTLACLGGVKEEEEDEEVEEVEEEEVEDEELEEGEEGEDEVEGGGGRV